jgi:hypothetical protein
VPPDAPAALCIVTFVTGANRCCYYATPVMTRPDGGHERLHLPAHVRSQLDAMAARVAWVYVDLPGAALIRGEAWNEVAAVTELSWRDVGRLVIT